MNKIAIITSACGSPYRLVTPSVVHENADYIAFVDRSHDCKAWEQRDAIDFTFDEEYKGRRNAKIYKAMPHLFLPEYDYYFWIDSTHDVTTNPQEIIDQYLVDSDIALFRHPHRKCAHGESYIINKLNLDDPDNTNRQLKFYEEENFPKNFGLFELGVSVRKNTKEINTLNLKWWEQICRFSSRDQVSFTYCLWKLGISPAVLPGMVSSGGPYRIGNKLIPQVRSKPHKRGIGGGG